MMKHRNTLLALEVFLYLAFAKILLMMFPFKIVMNKFHSKKTAKDNLGSTEIEFIKLLRKTMNSVSKKFPFEMGWNVTGKKGYKEFTIITSYK